jgi:uncharacterized membrane protein YhhN
MKIPVTIYALVIAAMGWFAVSRWFQDSQFDKLLAASGAMFFIAYNKFKNSFKSSQFFVLSTYFLAQWLIALSVLFF